MHVFYTVQFTVLIKEKRFQVYIVNCRGMHVFYTAQCTVLRKGERFQVYSKLQRDARFLYCTVYSSNKGGTFSILYRVQF